jgi:uncharacterized protein YeaO (DUF488 family)
VAGVREALCGGNGRRDAKPHPRHVAALSKDASFSVGCYCENEARCHRSVLRRLLKERGAKLA